MRYTLLFLGLLSFSATAQNAFVRDSLDTYVTREMQRWNIPGLAVAIVKDGKIVLTKGYGIRDMTKPGEKVDENTLFQIASNTKAFTGTALAKLEYEKRLSLDDKATRWLKDFRLYDPLATQEVTIRDLITHRIGFDTFEGDFLNWNSNLTREQVVAGMARLKPTNSFRAKYGYCNAGFLAAGQIIPAVTDTTWDDYLTHHFFRPLRMTRTSTRITAYRADANVVRPHTMVDGKLIAIEPASTDNIGPAASVNSCVKDLANWLLLQLGNGQFEGRMVLPAAVLQKTRQSNMVAGDIQSSLFPTMHFQTYGLGWFMNDYNGRKVLHHSGGTNGSVTNTYMVPELQLGVIVLTNTDSNSLYDMLCRQLLEAYMDVPYRNLSQIAWERSQPGEQKALAEIRALQAKASASAGPKRALKAYTGMFRNDFYGDLSIREEAGKLNLYLSHHPQVVGRLQHLQDETFLCTWSDPTMGVKELPFTVEGDQVKAITVSVNDFIDYKSYIFTKTKG